MLSIKLQAVGSLRTILTSYTPADKNTCDGLVSVLKLPSPKSHSQVVSVCVLLLSLKLIVPGEQIIGGLLKSAIIFGIPKSNLKTPLLHP